MPAAALSDADDVIAAPPPSSRRYVLLAIKIGVSVLLLSWLFSHIDGARLWASARRASVPWLGVALALYGLTIVASVWRWHLLLEAQNVHVAPRKLAGSFLVGLFFNNFLPSNVGGDVIRISDTAKAARSKTLAATVVLMDRAMGLMALVLVAACAASVGATGARPSALPIVPMWLWAGFFIGAALSAPAVLAPAGFGRLLQPLRVFHPEWVGGRIDRLTGILTTFRDHPGALASCFSGAILVQAGTVLFYVVVAHALHLGVRPWDLAVIVPISFVIQMAPVSINGFGVREATFSLYFARIGQPLEAALLVSLVPTALVMLFSLCGAGVYVSRRHH